MYIGIQVDGCDCLAFVELVKQSILYNRFLSARNQSLFDAHHEVCKFYHFYWYWNFVRTNFVGFLQKNLLFSSQKVSSCYRMPILNIQVFSPFKCPSLLKEEPFFDHFKNKNGQSVLVLHPLEKDFAEKIFNENFWTWIECHFWSLSWIRNCQLNLKIFS